MGLLLLIFFSVYALLLLIVILEWLRLRQANQEQFEGELSVIVPFRDEERNLRALVQCLEAQRYAHYEVVFVNDHSEDRSLSVLSDALQGVDFDFRVESLKETNGKKAAISHGMAQVSGEVILTTDADCWFGPEWISQMVKPFSDPKVKMVSGPVRLEGQSLFQKWQAMEFMVLIVTGAVSIALKKPTMANGANLAYRKSVFQELKGFDGIGYTPSGDDELLLMKMHRQYPGSIRFQKSEKAIVSTLALTNWQQFKAQRLRWASKWFIGLRPGTLMMAFLVFFFNLLLVLLVPFAFLGWVKWSHAYVILGIRAFAELSMVFAISRFFKMRFSLPAFLLHQLLYPFYAIYFGLMANFGNYHWKGRSYRVRHNKYDRRRV